jgi:hypothetical protein
MTPILALYVLASALVALALLVDYVAGRPAVASPAAALLMCAGNILAVAALLAILIAWVIG